MESLLIWLLAFFVAAAIFIPYTFRFKKNLQRDRLKKTEAIRLGADKPIAQYPQIDTFLCIGCGSCVDACPEGGVLGIVSGKATIINGLKCVGHGLCALACPVEGIKVGLGDISKRDDIPILNDKKESSIPGLFIAGELGGLALIKNAIEEGRLISNYLEKTKESWSSKEGVDVLIVGAGPAGFSAVLNCIEHKMSYILIDQQGSGGTILNYPRKKIVMTRPVDLPLYGSLKKSEYSKEELLEIWQLLTDKHKIQAYIGEKLTDISYSENGFTVITDIQTHKAKNVILALGRRGTPRKLRIPGEEKAKVMYKLMDAESYTNNHLLVVGGGDSAIEAAIALAYQKGNTVSISYRKDTFFRIKKRNEERLQTLVKENKIHLYFNSNLKEIQDKAVIMSDENDSKTLENDYIFIFAGGEAPFKLLKKIGIRFGGE